jgi:uncharacterized membrane protein
MQWPSLYDMCCKCAAVDDSVQSLMKRNRRGIVWLAWIVVIANLLLIAGAATFAHFSRSVPSLHPYHSWQGLLIEAIPAIAFLLTGLLILIRIPVNRYGWILIAFSFALEGVRGFSDSYGSYLYQNGAGSQKAVALAAHFAGFGWSVAVAMLAFILLWFPTGDYPSRRWRIAGWLTLLGLGGAIVGGPLASGELGSVAPIENPFGLPGQLGQVLGIIVIGSGGGMFLGALLGVVSVVVRYLRATGIERQQIKWFAFAALIFGIGLVIDTVTDLPGIWEVLKESLFLVPLPAAIGMAVLRYRLWDIDIIIRRTLVYGALSLTLALIYFGSIVMLQSLFVAASGQRSTAAVVISTLVIAALFTPLRRRIQNDIDRRFFRRKYDAQKTLEAFSASLREELDLDELSDRLLAAVEDTLEPAHASLWIRERKKS